MQQVKVIRILEYIGDEAWMARQLANSAVKGTKLLPNDCSIREVYCSPPQTISDSIPTPEGLASNDRA